MLKKDGFDRFDVLRCTEEKEVPMRRAIVLGLGDPNPVDSDLPPLEIGANVSPSARQVLLGRSRVLRRVIVRVRQNDASARDSPEGVKSTWARQGGKESRVPGRFRYALESRIRVMSSARRMRLLEVPLAASSASVNSCPSSLRATVDSMAAAFRAFC